MGALAYDPGTQSVYVGGTTCATSGLGPAASGYQSTNYSSGCYDGYVTRLTSTLATATNMTYLGGSYYDGIAGLRVDASGSVYAAGATWSGHVLLVAIRDHQHRRRCRDQPSPATR